jgi:hypothetical protein
VSATGVESSRDVEVRAYPAPKRDAAGSITIDGEASTYKRTGGKGRGTVDNRYAYATVKGTPGYFAITEPEAAALVGGVATLTSIVAPVAPAAPVEGEQAPAPAPAKALRRVKAQA